MGSPTTYYTILTVSEFTSLPTPPTLWRGPTLLSPTTSSLQVYAASELLNVLSSSIFSSHSSLILLAIPRTERLDKLIKSALGEDGAGGKLVWNGEEDGLDVWSEVAVRRPVEKVNGEWDLGE